MSADLLRRAAALMRERATGITPAPWSVGTFTCEVRGNDGRNYVGSTYGGILGMEELNAQHIASWHPAVALAVADWLDETADNWTRIDPLRPHFNNRFERSAYMVARAYLGEES